MRYPEYRDIQCNCVRPKYRVIDVAEVGWCLPSYKLIDTPCETGWLFGALSPGNSNPHLFMRNRFGTNVWGPRALSPLPIVTCDGEETVLQATMTATSRDEGDVTIEIATFAGDWVATYQSMAAWQTHCDLAMKLVDYDPVACPELVNKWAPYATLRPVAEDGTACGEFHDYYGFDYSVAYSGSDPLLTALGDQGPFTGTMWYGLFAYDDILFHAPDALNPHSPWWVIRIRLGHFTPSFTVTSWTMSVRFINTFVNGQYSDSSSFYGASGSYGTGTSHEISSVPLCWPSDPGYSGSTLLLPGRWPDELEPVEALEGSADVSATRTLISSESEDDCNPSGAGPGEVCQGTSSWNLQRKECSGWPDGYHIYWWQLISDACSGRGCFRSCDPQVPFALPPAPISEEEAEDLGLLDTVNVTVSGTCGCDKDIAGSPDCPPPPCQGTSTWTLRRTFCPEEPGPGLKYVYYWEPSSDTCEGGTCSEGRFCWPTVPYNLSGVPITEEEATALGYDEDLDQVVSGGGCECDETGYEAPGCPECENCNDVVADKELIISSGPAFYQGTYTLVKEASPCSAESCCWAGTNSNGIVAILSYSAGVWSLDLDSGLATYASEEVDVCTSPITLDKTSGPFDFPGTIQVDNV